MMVGKVCMFGGRNKAKFLPDLYNTLYASIVS